MALPPDRCIACKTQSLVSAEEMPNHVASKHPEFAFKCGPCASQNGSFMDLYFSKMADHLRAVHGVSNSNYVTSTLLAPSQLFVFLCQMCEIQMISKEQIVTHIENNHFGPWFKKSWGYLCRICSLRMDYENEETIQKMYEHINSCHPRSSFASEQDVLEHQEEDKKSVQDPRVLLENQNILNSSRESITVRSDLFRAKTSQSSIKVKTEPGIENHEGEIIVIDDLPVDLLQEKSSFSKSASPPPSSDRKRNKSESLKKKKVQKSKNRSSSSSSESSTSSSSSSVSRSRSRGRSEKRKLTSKSHSTPKPKLSKKRSISSKSESKTCSKSRKKRSRSKSNSSSSSRSRSKSRSKSNKYFKSKEKRSRSNSNNSSTSRSRSRSRRSSSRRRSCSTRGSKLRRSSSRRYDRSKSRARSRSRSRRRSRSRTRSRSWSGHHRERSRSPYFRGRSRSPYFRGRSREKYRYRNSRSPSRESSPGIVTRAGMRDTRGPSFNFREQRGPPPCTERHTRNHPSTSQFKPYSSWARKPMRPSSKMQDTAEFIRYRNGEFDCKICGAISFGRYQYELHKKQERHKKALSGTPISKSAPSTNTADPYIDSNQAPVDETQEYHMFSNGEIKCNYCYITFKNLILFGKHKATIEHKALAMKAQEALKKEGVPPTDEKPTIATGKFFCNYSTCMKWCSTLHYTCDTCQIHCNEKRQFDQHLKGKGHLKNVKLKNMTPTELSFTTFVPPENVEKENVAEKNGSKEQEEQGKVNKAVESVDELVDQFECHSCDKKFVDLTILLSHINETHQNLIACKICKTEKFLTFKDLRNHLKHEHNQSIEESDLVKVGDVNHWRQGFIQCNLCHISIGKPGFWFSDEINKAKIRSHFKKYHTSFYTNFVPHIALGCQLCLVRFEGTKCNIWRAHLSSHEDPSKEDTDIEEETTATVTDDVSDDVVNYTENQALEKSASNNENNAKKDSINKEEEIVKVNIRQDSLNELITDTLTSVAELIKNNVNKDKEKDTDNMMINNNNEIVVTKPKETLKSSKGVETCSNTVTNKVIVPSNGTFVTTICAYCGEQVESKGYLQHIKDVHSDLSFGCRRCPASQRHPFQRLNDVFRHLNLVHSGCGGGLSDVVFPGNKTDLTGLGFATCKLCGFIAYGLGQTLYKHHEKKHAGVFMKFNIFCRLCQISSKSMVTPFEDVRALQVHISEAHTNIFDLLPEK